MSKDNRQWKVELIQAQRKERELWDEDPDNKLPAFEKEHCVICEVRTTLWLMPENAPLCGDECMAKYLQDPTVYDPRGLYAVKNKKPKRVVADGRWNPSEDDIAKIQGRIRGRKEDK